MTTEQYEKFAKEFYAKYGYLPLGKDDPARPDAEQILLDLANTFSALAALRRELEAANEKLSYYRAKEKGDIIDGAFILSQEVIQQLEAERAKTAAPERELGESGPGVRENEDEL